MALECCRVSALHTQLPLDTLLQLSGMLAIRYAVTAGITAGKQANLPTASIWHMRAVQGASTLLAGCARASGPTLDVCMSLSMPLGPRVVLIASTTAIQALMLLISCALP